MNRIGFLVVLCGLWGTMIARGDGLGIQRCGSSVALGQESPVMQPAPAAPEEPRAVPGYPPEAPQYPGREPAAPQARPQTGGAALSILVPVLLVIASTAAVVGGEYWWKKRRSGGTARGLPWVRRPSLVGPILSLFGTGLLATIAMGESPIARSLLGEDWAKWAREHSSLAVPLVGFLGALAIVMILRAITIGILLRVKGPGRLL